MWTEIAAALAIEVEHEYTPYIDTAGSTTAFYRFRYRKPSAGDYSDYSASFKVGTSIPKTWITANITDSAVTGKWDQWIDEAVIDIFAEGIWYEKRQTITPAKDATTSVLKEYYELDQQLREVFQVEIVEDTSPNRHIEWLGADEWAQEARELRIFDPDDSFKYVAHGLGQYRRLGELTDDYWDLVMWQLRRAYLDYVIEGVRLNFRKYVLADPTSDATLQDLERRRAIANAEVQRRSVALAPRTPAYAAS